MSLSLELDPGTAELHLIAGERFVMRATRSAAPGTPLRGRIVGSNEVLDLKVARCVRQGDGEFEIEGRLVNLPRTQRALLSERLA